MRAVAVDPHTWVASHACPCASAAAPRNASVFTSAPSRVWRLKARVFKRTVIAATRRRVAERVTWLSDVKILKPLSAADLQRVATVMEELTFAPDAKIITQGDTGDAFYIIKSGNVVCNVNGVGDVATLGPGTFAPRVPVLRPPMRTASASCARVCDLLQASSSARWPC